MKCAKHSAQILVHLKVADVESVVKYKLENKLNKLEPSVVLQTVLCKGLSLFPYTWAMFATVLLESLRITVDICYPIKSVENVRKILGLSGPQC